jgi:hypothetical protein
MNMFKRGTKSKVVIRRHVKKLWKNHTNTVASQKGKMKDFNTIII